jgi:hypothetical protein
VALTDYQFSKSETTSLANLQQVSTVKLMLVFSCLLRGKAIREMDTTTKNPSQISSSVTLELHPTFHADA